MTDISCVLFDCDSTLVDSETLCGEAYTLVCALYGIDINLEQAIKRFKGVKLYTARRWRGCSISALSLSTASASC